MSETDIKICGLKERGSVREAIKAGARWVGFVHFEKSPRHVLRSEGAELVASVKSINPDVETVILLVNPTVDEAVSLADEWGVDHIQLHGSEDNQLILDIRARRKSGEIWKALPVSAPVDLQAVADFPAADRFLFDAKPPKDADRPGGWGHSFDWTILKDFSCDLPWLLAGGLNPDNVAEAVEISGAKAVDVSSGVESEKGVKDVVLINTFASSVHG